MSKIIVENLKYRYPSEETLTLDDISFEVGQGEFIGIIGQNDSGKSTLCQALVGLVPHFYKGSYGGRVVVDGNVVMEHTVSDMALIVGTVFQNPFTQMTGSKPTVYEEIAFGLENMGLDRREMVKRIDYALKLLNIEDCKDKNPFALSGGQMQRVAIAGIIAMKPQIMVLDEPTSQLDPQGSREVLDAIKNLSGEGITILLAEQKTEKLAEYCNRILALSKGKLVGFDTPSKFFSRDDLHAFGIRPPVYTRVCKRLGVKGGGDYPVTLQEAVSVLEKQHDSSR